MSDYHQQDGRSARIPKLGQDCSFPQKVHALLQYAQTNGLESIACWTADGKGFHIFSPNGFMQEIAPHFFPKHASFRSFERMLNLWGFKRERAPPPQKLFQNSNFQRDRPELCRNISRNENKGTKQLVSLSGIQRHIHVKNNIPNWAKEHQQAAIKYFSTQNSLQVGNTSKATNRPRSLQNGEIIGHIDSHDEEKQKRLQSQPEPYKLRSQTERGDRHERNSALCPPYNVHQANIEELGHPEFIRLGRLSREASYPHINEQTRARTPQDLFSSNMNTRFTSHQWNVEMESHVSAKSNEMLSEKPADTKRRHSLSYNENDGFGTLPKSSSAKAFPEHTEGQFDDAPDSLLVLANVAGFCFSENDSCTEPG